MDREDIVREWEFSSILIDINPVGWCPLTMRVNDKIFVREKGGVAIFPMDGSYYRFISDSWYDGVDLQNL